MKQIEITKLSTKYNVRKLNTDDVDMIYHFCKSNTQYYTCSARRRNYFGSRKAIKNENFVRHYQ